LLLTPLWAPKQALWLGRVVGRPQYCVVDGFIVEIPLGRLEIRIAFEGCLSLTATQVAELPAVEDDTRKLISQLTSYLSVAHSWLV
jgi:hypothetical protein